MCAIDIFYCSVYPFVRLSFPSSLFTWGLTYGCAHLARLRPRVRLGCTSTVLPRPSVSCFPRREGLCGTSREGEDLGEEGEEEGEHLFCLGQMHDTLQEREAAASEWPPDF